VLFPSWDPNSGTLAEFIDQKIECEVCRALNALDGLSRDCDEFDNGLPDASCGGQAACEYGSSPTCGGSCPQGETCVDTGTDCVCLQDSQECTQTGAPTCPGWCANLADQCLVRGGSCLCLPPTACEATYPTCNGTCPPGENCVDTGSVCVCQGPQPAPQDHFKLYDASGVTAPQAVSLVDQFGAEATVVDQVVAFMPPVVKDPPGDPLINPGNHLTCYALGGTFGPLDVLVQNQFGEQPLTVYDPAMLCLPSDKVSPDDGLAPDPSDHYKCYWAGGDPVHRVVTLTDQFHVEFVDVVEPVLFCNPVDKNGEGIIDPLTHLTCYYIAPPGILGLWVAAINQFGWQEMTVNESVALCVPSTKELLP
jgi:hypothetical protein